MNLQARLCTRPRPKTRIPRERPGRGPIHPLLRCQVVDCPLRRVALVVTRDEEPDAWYVCKWHTFVDDATVYPLTGGRYRA